MKFASANKKLFIDKELILVFHQHYNASAYEFLMLKEEPKMDLLGRLTLRIDKNEDVRLYRGHIGYTVIEKHRGHNYAYRSCKLIIPIIKYHQINPVIITCDPDNIASAKTIEKLGAKYIETVELPEDHEYYLFGSRQKKRYFWQFD